MVTLLTNRVKRLMSERVFEMDADSINKDFYCNLCQKIMINAYQTYCGCNYCRGCIVVFLAGKDNYCPGSKEECKEERLVLETNVLLNPILNQNILKAKVHCPNKECHCITELNEIEEHLRVCTQKSVECPFSAIGCVNGESSKETILTHLHNEIFAHSELFTELIQNILMDINVLKEDKHELSGLRKESRLNEVQIVELKREMGDKMKEQKECMIEHEEEMENQKRETNKIKRELERLKRECDKRETLEKRIKELEEEVVLKDEDIKKKDGRIKIYEQEKERLLSSMANAVDKVTIESLKMDKEKLDKELADSKNWINRKQSALETMKIKIEEGKKLEARLNDNIARQTVDLDICKKEVNEYKEKYEYLTKLYNDSKTKVYELVEKVLSLERELRQAKRGIQNMDKGNDGDTMGRGDKLAPT